MLSEKRYSYIVKAQNPTNFTKLNIQNQTQRLKGGGCARIGDVQNYLHVITYKNCVGTMHKLLLLRIYGDYDGTVPYTTKSHPSLFLNCEQ